MSIISSVSLAASILNSTVLGNYEGSIIKEFDIEKLDPEKLTFSIDGEIKAYTGNEIKPGLKNVQYNNIDLTQEQYTVSYRNNIAAADKSRICHSHNRRNRNGIRKDTLRCNRCNFAITHPPLFYQKISRYIVLFICNVRCK